ncbi:hypothetical protein [Haloterrigena alkaliphila]|uniref:Uncharacterized protein n=1 Tax=Haloterrigena alkaliphila TaxID=2816475 RepID=A0A8A2VD37_9EURY|nr:hypothetical protein [Haloterrigena alkaliphila]QSW99963.1 hypothetical protein J0X25_03090 [Haloterrigena alkaliphila]
MSNHPPSPPTPATGGPATAGDDRVVATTTQLSAQVEDSLGLELNADALESLLLELDRGDYVEWVTVTRDGEYVWDLTDSPDRIADAVAAAVMCKIDNWLEARAGE